MSTRTARLLALALWVLPGCTLTQVLSEPVVSPTGPLAYETLYTGGAHEGDAVPTVVAVHGRGDTPANFGLLVRDLPVRARVLLPRGPNALGQGYSWFPFPVHQRTEETMAPGIRAAEERLALFLRGEALRAPHCGLPVLVGFSQGAMLAFAATARHPELLAGAIPVAGALSRSMMPLRAPANAPPLTALHGTLDAMVPYRMGELTVQWLTERGYDARFERFDGVEHRFTTRERDRVLVLLREYLARACPAG